LPEHHLPPPLMDVVAYLPPSLRQTLHAAVGRAHSVRDAEDWPALGRLLRGSAVDAVILDPTVAEGVYGMQLAALSRRHARVPMVVYTSLTAPAMRAVAALGSAAVRDVVLAGIDDAPERLLAVVERQPGLTLGAAVVHRLAGPLDSLPTALGEAIRRMLLRSGEVTNASELAAAAGMPRRTLYRSCEAAGFASPSVIVRAARLLHAYAWLRDADQSAGDVVERLGYSSRQLFWRHVWETFDMRPTDLRRDLRSEEFVRRLAGVIRPEPAVERVPS
jgi:AraC-like DNA-binding protein